MNNVTCHYTQYKCWPYVGSKTQTSNCKALLTEPLRHIVMDKKNITGAYRFLTTAPTGWFLSLGENQYWKPHSREEGVGVRQLGSHVNTNTILREEKEDCTLFKKNEGISIFLSHKGEQI